MAELVVELVAELVAEVSVELSVSHGLSALHGLFFGAECRNLRCGFISFVDIISKKLGPVCRLFPFGAFREKAIMTSTFGLSFRGPT